MEMVKITNHSLAPFIVPPGLPAGEKGQVQGIQIAKESILLWPKGTGMDKEGKPVPMRVNEVPKPFWDAVMSCRKDANGKPAPVLAVAARLAMGHNGGLTVG